jgi:tetratricopeptide (TPR) repeat protein/transcriptional regulator with XRE-family HTH domain
VLLRRHRMAAALTQEGLAERSGLSVRAIRDMERGRTASPNSSSIRLLADALKLSGQAVEELATTACPVEFESLPAVAGHPAGAAESALRPVTVPRQLPAGAADFVGRDAQLKVLGRLLDSAGRTGPVVISVIGGTAGVGKTALALQWAHQVADRFPDGQLYADLRGFSPSGAAAEPAVVIRGFLDALGVPRERIPAGLDDSAALYRSVLAGRRLLVVLDNARDEQQARPLLPGSRGCVVLVTSRRQLAGLIAIEGARPVAVDTLARADARELLARRLGSERVTSEPEAVTELTELCARLPLALVVAAARAAARPGFPLGVLAAELRDAGGRLDALDVGDATSSVRAVFSWSYRQLSVPAAGMFRLLGVHPGPDVSVPAAASLFGARQSEARKGLAELASAYLVTEHRPGRYVVHDLLRAYAAEQGRIRDDGRIQRAAVGRMLDHYLHSACAAAGLLDPPRDQLTLQPPAEGVVPEWLADYTEALAWFDAEHDVLLEAVRLAHGAGFDEAAWQLPSALTDFLYLRGHWHDMAATQQTALDAASRGDDRAGQAVAHRHLARAHALLGSRPDAEAHYRQALRLFRQAGDHIGQGRCHYGLAWSCEHLGRHDAALGHGRQALAQFRAASHRDGQAMTLNAIGWFHAQRGDHQQAVIYCQDALSLCRELGDRHSEAATWDSLGYARHHLGQYPEAVDSYQQALALFEELRDGYNEAATLINLGDTHHAFSNPHAADGAWRQALVILEDLRHPHTAQVQAKLRSLRLAGDGSG